MLKTLIQAALVAALFPAAAGAGEQLALIHVSYADLDFSDPADVRRLDRRLVRAIAVACPDSDGVRQLSHLRQIARCQATQWERVAAERAAALAGARDGSGSAGLLRSDAGEGGGARRPPPSLPRDSGDQNGSQRCLSENFM